MCEESVVVVADKGWKLECSVRTTFIQHVILEHSRQYLSSRLAGHGLPDRGCEREVENCGQMVNSRVDGKGGRICSCARLAEDVEVRYFCSAGAIQHGGHEALPELRVHVFGGVDAI